MRKTTFKYDIPKCPRCGRSHIGYRGKLDEDDEEYVVCGNTHKKMLRRVHTDWTLRVAPLSKE